MRVLSEWNNRPVHFMSKYYKQAYTLTKTHTDTGTRARAHTHTHKRARARTHARRDARICSGVWKRKQTQRSVVRKVHKGDAETVRVRGEISGMRVRPL